MPGMINHATIRTALGDMTFVEKDGAIVALNIDSHNVGADIIRPGRAQHAPIKYAADNPVLNAAIAQMNEYLSGRRREFDLPLAPAGTEFQKSIWAALRQIPYGETIDYATLARNAGRPRAVRAAGNANGKNPIPIIIPCHRVIAADGTIGGFSLGVELKKKLLEIETVSS